MTIEEAERIIKKRTFPWTLDPTTFASLGEDQAIVRASRGEDTFFALLDARVGLFQVFTLEESALPALLDWCLKMSTKGNK
jgi:hypothetical protein